MRISSHLRYFSTLKKHNPKKNLKKKSAQQFKKEKQNLSLENLSSKELDFKLREKRLEMEMKLIGGENRSGNLPSIGGLLELNQPLISSHAVTRLSIMIQDMNGLGYLDLQVHNLQKFIIFCLLFFPKKREMIIIIIIMIRKQSSREGRL